MDRFAKTRYGRTNPDSVLICADLLNALARTEGTSTHVAQAFVLRAIGHMGKGEVEPPIPLLDSAIHLFRAAGDDERMMGALNAISSAYANKGDFARGIASLTEALRISEAQDDSSMTARILGNIGALYHMQDDLDNALDYYQRRLVIAEALDQKDILSEVIGNIAVIHEQRGQFDLALNEYARALLLAREIGYEGMVTTSLQNMASVYMKQGRFNEALSTFREAVDLARSIDDGAVESSANVGLADTYLQMKEPTKALRYGLEGMRIATSLGNVNNERDAAEVLFKINKALGNGRDALMMHELFISLRDSMKNDENRSAMMTQKFQYDFEKKEALLTAEQEKKDAIATEELRRKNVQRNAFIGGFGLMVLLAGVFFVQRNRINKEKQRSEELLLNILPEEVAEELKSKGSAEAVHIDQVTVVFTDFKGFTAMSEVLSPKDLVRDLHECFSAFDHLCEKHGLEKIKTIGDAYMAAGGLPTPNTTHATDVIKAALEMRDFIAEGKARKIAAGLPFFEIRIGVHTGPVVAGIVGVKKFSYDIWGDTVNTASRMESSGEVGQVNISEATYALVMDQPAFTFTPRGKVQAKGKGEMEMYFVHHSDKVA